MEQNIQSMIENLNEFGIDAKNILEFSDIDALKAMNDAITEYKQNKNGSQTDDSIW